MNTTAATGRWPSRPENQPWVTPFTRRATDDRHEAQQIVTELYLPNQFDLSKGSAPLAMNAAGLRMGALTAGRLTYGRQVCLRTADAENFHVNIPLRGRAASRSGTDKPVTTGPGEGTNGAGDSEGFRNRRAWPCRSLLLPPETLRVGQDDVHCHPT